MHPTEQVPGEVPGEVPGADPTPDPLLRAARLLVEEAPFASRIVAAEHAGGDASAAAAWLAANAAGPWDAARIAGAVDDELARSLAAPSADPEGAAVAACGAALRRVRRRLLAGLMVRDVAGVAPLQEVVGAMTALAEIAVRQGLRAVLPPLVGRHGVPRAADGTPQDLLVVAMGKGGGGELNVSSDLDLVFVYDEDGETAAAPGASAPSAGLRNQQFFERAGRALIALLSDAAADGFVFRVDMRLRPDGDAGPLSSRRRCSRNT